MNNNIEQIMKEIITIDKEAEDYKKAVVKSLEDKRLELKEQIAAMQKEAEMNLSKRKKEIMDDKLMETKKNIQSLKVEREIAIKKIKENYENGKGEIVKSAINKLVDSSMRD